MCHCYSPMSRQKTSWVNPVWLCKTEKPEPSVSLSWVNRRVGGCLRIASNGKGLRADAKRAVDEWRQGCWALVSLKAFFQGPRACRDRYRQLTFVDWECKMIRCAFLYLSAQRRGVGMCTYRYREKAKTFSKWHKTTWWNENCLKGHFQNLYDFQVNDGHHSDFGCCCFIFKAH